MMTSQRKAVLLIFLGFAVLAIIVLSAGISRLELAASEISIPVVDENSQGVRRPAPTPFEGDTGPVNVIFSLAMLLALLVSMVHFILSPEARKRVLQRFLRLTTVLFAVYIIATRLALRLENLEGWAPEGGEGSATLFPLEEIVANVPLWLTFTLTFGLIVLVLLSSFVLWRRSRRPPTTLELLTGEAKAALEELRSGADFKNTIIACYYEMCQVLSREKGIRRTEAMTAREFERSLAEIGMPGEPVQQLTRLFEAARYGAGEPGEQEEHQARACLAAIAETNGRAG